MDIAIKTLLFILAFMVGVIFYFIRHLLAPAGGTHLFDLALFAFALSVLAILFGGKNT
jgi:hypothetical protein